VNRGQAESLVVALETFICAIFADTSGDFIEDAIRRTEARQKLIELMQQFDGESPVQDAGRAGPPRRGGDFPTMGKSLGFDGTSDATT
jgi:hypothetical protein